MGGCATKPKGANFESLPSENPSSPKQETRAIQGDPAVAHVKVDTGKDKTVKNSNRQEPLADLSDPTPDAPKHGGQQATAIADLVSEIGGSKLDSSSNPFENSDDMKKGAEVDHVEEKKTADPAKASEIPAAPATTAEKEQKTQKHDVEAEKEHKPQKSNVEVEAGSSESDLVDTKDIKPEISEKELGENSPLSA